jgi:hypothetical protein
MFERVNKSGDNLVPKGRLKNSSNGKLPKVTYNQK